MKIIVKVDVRPDARGQLVTIQSGPRCMTYLPARAPTPAAAQCWAVLRCLENALACGDGKHDLVVHTSFAPDRTQHYWRVLQQRLAQGACSLDLVQDQATPAGAGAGWLARWFSPAQALA
ncbi:hypothetical protein [Asticcacaulis sp.]|uniref:hypothetical protein n=1 Tax=Asticcacaulis sp. TaxID=1872648 RepID=UPI002613A90C|nr:hypothetical protein [Asticcacaulis sp.]